MGSNIYISKTIKKYNDFVNEMKISPSRVDFNTTYIKSPFYDNKDDIIAKFTLNKHDYIILLSYFIDDNIESYNILFTTQKQYDTYTQKLYQIIKSKQPGDILTDDEHKELVNIIEKETEYNELFPLLKNISYILIYLYNNMRLIYGDIIFSIGDTTNPVKVKLYRNIIKDSFPNFVETKTIDSQGNDIYYYQ